ncbi:lysine-specific metallo-endopeptidase [Cladochytrium replicatum]|nr:lysine-specific metallo-endopeptidase [Cladochytrium replicatum]
MFAFVQPTNPIFEITLCDHFWSAKPIGGDDTRAGTLVHEMSHFVNVGGTQDPAYGRKNAIALTDEVEIGNAENYEHYGESLVPS